MTSGFIEDWLRMMAIDVRQLDLEVMSASNANAAAGKLNAMSNQLLEAANLTATSELGQAIDQLNALRLKVDGDPTPPDWMQPCVERDQLLAEIDLAIMWLQDELP